MKKTIVVDISKQKKLRKRITVDGKQTIVLLATKSADAIVEIVFDKKSANATIFGVVVGNDNATVNFRTVQHHKAPNTTSNLLIKSILAADAKFYYDGLIRVEKKAQGADAYQHNDTLLLSPKAHIKTKPALEILANDVRCTHGATISNIDKEQQFYLQSRGIQKKNAEQLIIDGFFADVLEKITDKAIQEQIRKKVGVHL